MYSIYADGNLMTTSQDEKTLVENPVVKLEANKAGTFTFTIYPNHDFYNLIKKHDTVLRVERDGEILFQGVAVTEEVNLLGGKTYSCEGELTYLNDSILRPKKYTNQTVQSLLSAYLTEHNSQVEAKKRFTLGDVDVTGGSTIPRYTNYQTTMKEIQDDLIDNFGGFISVRYSGANKYIDYHLGSQRTCTQTIELGKNLLSYSSNLDTTDICTVLVPLGAREEETSVEGLETRLTIKSVNNNKDYLESANGIATYGRITKVQTWDDVNVPSILKTKGQQWLSDQQFDNVVISCSAVDLSYTDSQVQRFRLLDTVRIISERHGMDKYFLLSKMTINLNEPGKDRFTFGKTEQVGLTAKSNNTTSKLQAEIAGIPPAASIIDKAVSQSTSVTDAAIREATAQITGADGGYIYIEQAQNGQPARLLILDNNDKSRAVNVIQINKNGIGFSNTGINGPYRNAWTIDGKLVADFITTGTLSADLIKTGKLNADLITVGHVNGGLLSGSIDAGLIKTGSLNANLITSGTINADLIRAGTLSADRIKAGVLASTNGASTIDMTTGAALLTNLYAKNRFSLVDTENTRRAFVGYNTAGGTSFIGYNQGGKIGAALSAANSDGGQLRLYDAQGREVLNAGLLDNNYGRVVLRKNGGNTFGYFDHYSNGGRLQLRNDQDYIIGEIYSDSNGGHFDLRNGQDVSRFFEVNPSNTGGMLILRNRYGSTAVTMATGAAMDGLINVCNSGGSYTINLSGESGWIYCTGVTQKSSRKLKENIKPLPDFMKVLELNPVKFDFKDHSCGTDVAGFIAEEVQEVLPGLVKMQNGILCLDYIQIIPYLLKVIQHQEERIKKLEEDK